MSNNDYVHSPYNILIRFQTHLLDNNPRIRFIPLVSHLKQILNWQGEALSFLVICDSAETYNNIGTRNMEGYTRTAQENGQDPFKDCHAQCVQEVFSVFRDFLSIIIPILCDDDNSNMTDEKH